jgi:hypothetical protein
MHTIATTDPILAEHAAEIRRLGKQTINNVIEIGRHLTEAKDIAGHGNFLPWLDREFGWTEMTATRFINVYEMSKSNNLLDLDLPLSGLYLLAAPSTPEAARQEVIERAGAGGKVPVAEVKRVVETAKGSAKKPRSWSRERHKAYRARKRGHPCAENNHERIPQLGLKPGFAAAIASGSVKEVVEPDPTEQPAIYELSDPNPIVCAWNRATEDQRARFVASFIIQYRAIIEEDIALCDEYIAARVAKEQSSIDEATQ